MVAAKRGRPKKVPKFKDLLRKTIPAADIFEPDELLTYEALVGIYLKDFDESQLTANDMDDIMSIAMNRVLEIRLLKASKGDATMQIDASTAIERLRKQTEKLKENLASRRKDRIDPKKYSGFSIVDMAVSFDMDKKREIMERASSKLVNEDEVKKSDLLIGNRDDEDADIIEEE
jgi:hypothetical protein